MLLISNMSSLTSSHILFKDISCFIFVCFYLLLSLLVWLKTQKTLTASILERRINAKQVIVYQKSWWSFSPITVCILAQCQCLTGGGGGGGGAYASPPEEAVSVLKNRALYDIASIR